MLSTGWFQEQIMDLIHNWTTINVCINYTFLGSADTQNPPELGADV